MRKKPQINVQQKISRLNASTYWINSSQFYSGLMKHIEEDEEADLFFGM